MDTPKGDHQERSVTIECHGIPTGLTLTAWLFLDGSDTIAASSLPMTEATNRKNVYSFSTSLMGLYEVHVRSGNQNEWIGWVDIVDGVTRLSCSADRLTAIGMGRYHSTGEIVLPLSTVATQPSEVKPVVAFNPPQITLEDGRSFALDDDQARYLTALIARGDWLSDPEFKQLHPEVGDNARPDQWRKALPDEVKSRIETQRNKGSRWQRQK